MKFHKNKNNFREVGERNDGKHYFIVLKCDCGNVWERRKEYHRQGRPTICKSCYVPAHKRPLYGNWKAMRQRCNDERCSSYERYGARGIAICRRWDDFSAFEEDMLPTYRKGLTLDRIDNNKGYSPENCRWATSEEQNNNTRKSRFIEHKGMRLSIAQWSREIGIKQATIRNRLNTGLPIHKVLSPKLL